MKIIINGVEAEVTTGLTISALLTERKVKMPDMVSVELNGEILDRNTFQTTTLKEADKVEFLYFMGGGTALNRAQARILPRCRACRKAACGRCLPLKGMNP